MRLYNWRAKYGWMDAAMLSEMKAIAEENRRLKRMYAEMAMQNELLKDTLKKGSTAISTARDGPRGRSKEGRFRCVGVPHFQHQ